MFKPPVRTDPINKQAVKQEEEESNDLAQVFFAEQQKKVNVKMSRGEVNELAGSFALLKICVSDPAISSRLSNILSVPQDVATRLILEPASKLQMKLDRQILSSEKKSLSEQGSAAPKRLTYFTAPINVTEDIRSLYDYVADYSETKFRYDQKNQTCPRDIFSMVKKYIEIKDLTDGKTLLLDDFLYPRLQDNSIAVDRNGNKYAENSSKTVWNVVKYLVSVSKSQG